MLSFDWIADPTIWASLVTLTVMEIVLGIDNIVFISVIVGRLPAHQAKRARQLGLAMALVFRIVFLLTLFWLIHLTTPLFTLFGQGFSWRDLILLAGGLFLLVKATREIHRDVEGEHEEGEGQKIVANFGMIVAQIALIDVIFSIDSIVTAIGMAEHVGVMIAAVVLAVAVMYAASGPVSGFIDRHPTTRMLALAFLLMIGAALVADSVGFHIPRGYLYAAMAFSALVEILNVLAKRNRAKREARKAAPHSPQLRS
jgi:predicted tellurium resistance membrane protein TerC